MALSQRQRWLVLGGCLALTLAAVEWVRGNGNLSPELVESNRAERRGGERAASEPAQTESVAELKADQIKRVPLAEVKDVFSSQTWQVPPAPRKPASPALPPLPFAYIGKVVDDTQVIVFLSAQDRNYAVKTGDVIDGMYRVDEIKPPTMTLTYLPLGKQQTLEIGRAN